MSDQEFVKKNLKEYAKITEETFRSLGLALDCTLTQVTSGTQYNGYGNFEYKDNGKLYVHIYSHTIGMKPEVKDEVQIDGKNFELTKIKKIDQSGAVFHFIAKKI